MNGEVSVMENNFQVFVAKFSYDPAALSPNDNPDMELSFQAGDYIFVYGEPDEDGFYEGELMDGRKGLVPSNYIEKVPEEELKEIDKPLTNGCDYDHNNGMAESPEQVVITEIIDNYNTVPPPKDLHLERQLSNSFVVAWQPPEESILMSEGVNLDSYLVTCNEQPITSVFIGDRTKTLLEKLDVNKSHRVSVRAVATDGRQSCEHLCTITIGKKARLAPSAVEVSQIEKRSASVQWNSASSYLQHRVSVDEDQWVHIMPAGVFKCLISGLQPNSSHTVHVSCIQNTSVDENCFVSSSVSFVTLPRDFPDPPSDVQAEIGPQKGTILVTWKPVVKDSSTNEGGKGSRKTNVTGYTVYIGGKKIIHLSNLHCDHMVINWKNHDFEESTAYNLTVRTTTDRWESPDSNPPTMIGMQLIQEVIKGRPTVFEGEELAFNRDGNLVESEIVNIKCDKKDLYNKNISIAKSLIERSTMERNKCTIPHIEVTKDALTQLSMDQAYEQQSLRISGRLRNKKVQTSPTLMRAIDKHSNVDYYDKATAMTLRKKHDISVGNDDDIYNNIPTIITTPATLNRNIKSEARNIALVEEDSMVGSDMERNDGSRVRLFVSLFDYNPSTMSPNPECSNEELQFSQGQLLKVFGEKDADGFYIGESNGVKGLIPSNMVSKVLVYNPLTAEQLLKDNLALCRNKQLISTPGRYNINNKKLPQLPYMQHQREGHRQTLPANRPRRMIAIHNYSPDKNIPETDTEFELCLKQGERLIVFGEPDQDGFIRAEIGQRKGVVPISHLRPTTPLPRMPGQKGRGRVGTSGRSLPPQHQYSSRRSYSAAPGGPQGFTPAVPYYGADVGQMSKQTMNNWSVNSSLDNPASDLAMNGPLNIMNASSAPLNQQFAQQCNVESYMYQS